MNRFTCGACMYLAYALNKKFGFPIGGLVVDEDMDGTYDDMVHVWVELPDGRVADIEGVHDREEFMDKWIDVSETQGDFEYEPSLSPEWLMSVAKSGRWTDQRQKIHRDTLKQAYRAIVDLLQHEFGEELITDDQGGLGHAPTSNVHQGVDSRAYGEAGGPGEPELP